MSLRTDVLLWAQRVIARKNGPPHVLLEVAENATAEQIQEAFHKIARTSHPDLHRHGLNAEELELVTSAYAACAGAYQQMRSATMRTQRLQPVKPAEGGESRSVNPSVAPRSPVATPPTGVKIASGSNLTQGTRHYQPSTSPPPTTTQPATPARAGQPSPPAGTPTTRPGTPPPDSGPSTAPIAQTSKPEQVMSSKALLYYRKAETCLRRGDLKGAMLQLKLACAADPASQFLRTALAEVEAELRKQP